MVKKDKQITRLDKVNLIYEKHKEKPQKLFSFFSALGKIFSALVSIFFFIVFISFFVTMAGSPIDSVKVPSGNIAVLSLSGEIITDSAQDMLFSASIITPGKVRKIFEKLEANEDIKAVIVELNSPGGSPVASALIGDIFSEFEKPIVVVIQDLGASGGYWIASHADKIYAHPLSFVGSIGVTASHLGFENFIREYNITYRRLVSAENKDTGSLFKEFTDKDKALFDRLIQQTHKAFVDVVAEKRNLSRKKVEELANGFVYTGMEAKEFGLVDELGTRKNAVEYLEKELNITAELAEVKTSTGLFSGLGQGLYKGMYAVGRGISSGLIESASKQYVSVKT